ncbi:energy transducer TonB [Limisalsivibrio acetivorans]|uniref:energy transducer TonB n=1 Tax=Limisalsivibrio acetivorans TaxID=1304888 RepID=UPI0003B55FA7|nr:energy transducer TonB [Limisalsivibrio acetivorans]
MNRRLILFILISAFIHLLVLQLVDLNVPESEEKKKPITVDVIEKKKPEPPEPKKPQPSQPQPQPEIVPEPDPEKPVRVKPEEAPPLPEAEEEKRAKPRQSPDRKPDKPVESEPEQREQKPSTAQEVEPLPPEKPDLPKVEKDDSSELNLSREQVDRILNPRDVIGKAAEGEYSDGEEVVSMTQVKLKYTSYFHKFKRRLYQTWNYPYDSGMRGEEGVVRIRFVIHKDGRITGVQVVESSGYPDLDKEAVRALKDMGGVPLPASYDKRILRVDGHFVYKIGGAFDIY